MLSSDSFIRKAGPLRKLHGRSLLCIRSSLPSDLTTSLCLKGGVMIELDMRTLVMMPCHGVPKIWRVYVKKNRKRENVMIPISFVLLLCVNLSTYRFQ